MRTGLDWARVFVVALATAVAVLLLGLVAPRLLPGVAAVVSVAVLSFLWDLLFEQSQLGNLMRWWRLFVLAVVVGVVTWVLSLVNLPPWVVAGVATLVVGPIWDYLTASQQSTPASTSTTSPGRPRG